MYHIDPESTHEPVDSSEIVGLVDDNDELLDSLEPEIAGVVGQGNVADVVRALREYSIHKNSMQKSIDEPARFRILLLYLFYIIT